MHRYIYLAPKQGILQFLYENSTPTYLDDGGFAVFIALRFYLNKAKFKLGHCISQLPYDLLCL
jgi:hypothetical protein